MIEGIIPEFLFNFTKIILFLKSHHFGKCSHLIFLYIIGYNNSWRSHAKIWGSWPQPSRIGAYAESTAEWLFCKKCYINLYGLGWNSSWHLCDSSWRLVNICTSTS